MFLPFLKRLNMCSLIANKVKINMYLVSIKLCIVGYYFCVPLFLTYTTITTCSLYFS